MDTTGLGVLAVGLMLCFAGVRSLNLAVLASGFAVGWLLTEPFDAALLTALVVAVAAAIAAWVVAHLVFRVALFFVGGLAGAVIGAKVFGLLQPSGGSVLLVVLFVAAAGFIGGIATQHFRQTALAVVCALGGAGLLLSGLARAFPDALGFLHVPITGWQSVVTTAAWLVIAVVGWAAQRRQLGEKDSEALAKALGAADDPRDGLGAYERERLPVVNNIVLKNRTTPPDTIIEVVEQRTNGEPYERLEDVISLEEVREISLGYQRVAGYDKETVARR